MPDQESKRDVPLIDPGFKAQINSEGFEGDERGGNAVFIGTKEEVTRALERTKAEGKVVDMATYISLHKETITAEEMDQLYKDPDNNLQNNIDYRHTSDTFKGFQHGDGYLVSCGFTNVLYYKDAKGSLCKVDIKMASISDLANSREDMDLRERTIKGLRELHFRLITAKDGGNLFPFLWGRLSKLKAKHAESVAEETRRANFDS